ncbi:MAG TPA: OmpA family protein [Myxococcales bacterium]|nr:OmpA family protein [Myxococcales bacterium]
MPKDQDKKVETISVTRAKAEAGLELKPGHKTIIIIEDGHGTHPATTTTIGGPEPVGTTTRPAGPGETTTAAPGETTTGATGYTTTSAPGETTTTAPGETTTAAAGYTTTSAPGETTTSAPGETTTLAPAYTTTEPGTTTTNPPGTTTTAAPTSTTTAPAATTTSPGTTTTRAPATTTTYAPGTTTTAPPAATTTGAPAATTTRKPVTPSKHLAFGSAHFDTDKILPLPGALDTFKKLVAFANENPDRIYLVVGHTDAQGPVAHNKDLSKERAQSIIQFLQEKADAWVPYYDDAKKGITSKTWGTTEDQHMLKGLGLYNRDATGRVNADFTKAIRDFQTKQNDAAGGKKVLPVTGTMDAKTRKALITAYMKIEGTSIPDTIKIRPLACGQGHQIENKVDSETNRRVDVFAFESEPIQPAPETCEGNKHPTKFVTAKQRTAGGFCEVYETWLTEKEDI